MIIPIRNLIFLGLFCVQGFALSTSAAAMSIEQAYQAIPHRQTPYREAYSPLPQAHKEYLQSLFELTDEAMRLRVVILQNFQNKHFVSMKKYRPVYISILQKIESLNPPPSLRSAHNLIIAAVRNHLLFFEEWAQSNKPHLFPHYNRHHLVLDSHRKLIQSYNILLRKYPQESQSNKQAFFDHLCALDFI